jgi:hypothetical protein
MSAKGTDFEDQRGKKTLLSLTQVMASTYLGGKTSYNYDIVKSILRQLQSSLN